MSDVIAACRKAAAEAGIPLELLLACCIAESNLDPMARRPKAKEQDAAYWPDLSFGIAQQTVRWSEEYAAWCRERGHPPAQYPGEEAVRKVGDRYYDVDHAASVAARNLAQKWSLYKPDLAKTLHAYNWPGGLGQPANAAAEQNYRRGLTEATRLLSMGGAAPSPTPAPPAPATPPAGAMKLSDVLSRARSRTGDPYVWGGKSPGGFDCSGFVSWAYQGKVPSFTDAILDATERTATPAPGDIVLWEYKDSSQPGVRFPHVGLYLDDGTTLDARYNKGVGEHPQLPRAQATRYYRRVPGVVVDTLDAPAPTPIPTADPRDARISGLETALAHVCDVIVPRAAELQEEARRIRVQFLGEKPP